MKKLAFVLLLCAIAWLVKMSYDFFQLSAQNSELQTTLQQVVKSNAVLNDQIAALKRDQQIAIDQSNPTENINALQNIDPMFVVAQQLSVVELALNQKQTIVALEKLHQLDINIENLPLAAELKQGLHQSVAKDLQLVQQFSQANLKEQERITALLQQVDQQLGEALKQRNLSIPVDEQTGFWQRWFKLERMSDVKVGLNQRDLILKEVQLRLMMARQLLIQDQYLEFQQELEQIQHILKLLPDAQAQNLITHIDQLKQTPKLAIPQLNTRMLVGAV